MGTLCRAALGFVLHFPDTHNFRFLWVSQKDDFVFHLGGKVGSQMLELPRAIVMDEKDLQSSNQVLLILDCNGPNR